jgi:Fic family protein
MSEITLNDRQIKIVNQFLYGNSYATSDIHSFISEEDVSVATIKRDLAGLVSLGYISQSGEKKASRYKLTDWGLIHRPLDSKKYFLDESLRKGAFREYNSNIFRILTEQEIFTEEEMLILKKETDFFRNKSKGNSDVINKKELERFIIELSWKSSRIEGNTYDLLDTEKLIREGVESDKNTKDEAIMILNHKKAFNYILECTNMSKSLESFRELENVHRLLVDGLDINHGLRKNAVGVTGTVYSPLGDHSRIEEETKSFIELIKKQKDGFSKALLSVLCISYLQSFEDGNKRTARLFANAMLLEEKLAPLSYRDVDEKEYREAVLIFYEQNSIEAFKKIFIEQYVFSCRNYNLG